MALHYEIIVRSRIKSTTDVYPSLPSHHQVFKLPKKKSFRVLTKVQGARNRKGYPLRKGRMSPDPGENEVSEEEPDSSNLRLAMMNRVLDLMQKLDETNNEEEVLTRDLENSDKGQKLDNIREKKISLQQNISIARDLLEVEFDMSSQFLGREATGLKPIEFDVHALYEELNVRNWTVLNKCYPTKELSRIMADFGGYPSTVFYRLAMKVVLRLFFKYFSKEDGRLMYRYARFDRSFALVGSRGVGKSSLLVFVAFFLAIMRGQRVLYLRKENDNTKHYLLYITPSSIRGAIFNSLAKALEEVDKISRGATFWFFVDGYTGEDLEAEEELREFSVLGTFSKTDVKTNHPARACHLAIWEYDELVAYSKQMMTWGPDEKQFKEEFTRRFRDSSGSIGNFLAGKRRSSSV